MSIHIFEVFFLKLSSKKIVNWVGFFISFNKIVFQKGAKPMFVLQRLKLCAIMLSRNISREGALVMSKVKISIQLFLKIIEFRHELQYLLCMYYLQQLDFSWLLVMN